MKGKRSGHLKKCEPLLFTVFWSFFYLLLIEEIGIYKGYDEQTCDDDYGEVWQPKKCI